MKRLIFVFCAFLAMFTILYVRLSWISFDNSLTTAAANQSTYTLSLNQTRGQIYDCRLVPLVGCEYEYNAVVLPSPQNLIPLAKSSDIIMPADIDLSSGRPFIVQSKSEKIDIPQVDIFKNPKRYSKNQLAQHVIGYYDKSNNTGVNGIEKQYNDVLVKNSKMTTISYKMNGVGKPLLGIEPDISLAPPVTDGIVLTIDKKVQAIVEKIGNRLIKRGAIVVLDPATGKQKAVASFPSYSATNIPAAMDNRLLPLINRAYTPYNVGSIFKLVTSATALEDGIPVSTKFTCNGEITLNGVTFGCHDKKGHGEIDMRQAIAVSCNPYFIQLSTMLNKTDFLNMAKDLSFGKSGNLPTESDLKNIGDMANLSFGQGSLTATPIEVAQLICAILNDGNTLPSTIVEGTTTDGKTIETAPHPYPTKAMKKITADILKSMMISAVMDTPKQNAKPNYTTAGGKTSTAQTGQFIDDREVLQGWFAGFYPADKPQYVIVVLVEDATNGNKDASPVFKAIADELM